MGLPLSEDKSRFKLYVGDTGLMVTLAFWDKRFTENELYDKLLRDKLPANLGYVYENLVAQMLRAAGNKLYKQHPNPNVDVAVELINAPLLQSDGIIVSFFVLGQESYTIADLKNIGTTEGDGVFVLGYPMGFIGATRQYVILRSGAIARIHDMLEGHSSDYIIDAFVFPGNSGGPVIIIPEITSIQGTQHNISSRLIGVVKSYIPYRDVAICPQTNRARVVF